LFRQNKRISTQGYRDGRKDNSRCKLRDLFFWPFHIFAAEPGMLTDTPDEYEKRIAALAGKYLKAAKDAATAAGVPCDVVHVEHEHPYETIIDTARKIGCDAIVMASHGRRGVSAIVLGSETGAHPQYYTGCRRSCVTQQRTVAHL
jgi:nucleotide-binding universal stress UspA family protein